MSNTKRLVEGQDFVLRYTEFPNSATDAAVVSHPDIDCVYINTRVCPKRQRIALQHELEHLANNDLYNDELTTEEIEGRMSI